MPYVPRMICAKCRIPMQLETSGVFLECHAAAIGPYYKVMSDKYRCSCGNEVFTGFGQKIEHYRPEFAGIPAKVKIDLEPHIIGKQDT